MNTGAQIGHEFVHHHDDRLLCCQERRQFGKAISEFQAIQFKLANMATELDAAWLVTMRAAQMRDDGKKVTMESTMAKVYASEAACRICDEGLQGVNRAEDDVKSET